MCYAREIQLALSEMQYVREMFPSETLLLKTFGFLPLNFCNNRFSLVYRLGRYNVLTDMGYILPTTTPNGLGLYIALIEYGLYLAHVRLK